MPAAPGLGLRWQAPLAEMPGGAIPLRICQRLACGCSSGVPRREGNDERSQLWCADLQANSK